MDVTNDQERVTELCELREAVIAMRNRAMDRDASESDLDEIDALLDKADKAADADNAAWHFRSEYSGDICTDIERGVFRPGTTVEVGATLLAICERMSALEIMAPRISTPIRTIVTPTRPVKKLVRKSA